MSKIEYGNKELERAAIEVAAAAVPQSKAVNSLVTQRMVSWMGARIDAGLDCDVYAEMIRLQDAARAATVAKEDAVRDRNDCKKLADANERRAVKYSNDLTEYERKLEKLDGRIQRRDFEILNLKAELYDLRKMIDGIIKSKLSSMVDGDIDKLFSEELRNLMKEDGGDGSGAE